MQRLIALGIAFQKREAFTDKDQCDLLSECPGRQGQIRSSLQRSRRLRSP